MKTVYDFTVKDRLGSDVSLADYRGKVLLIVTISEVEPAKMTFSEIPSSSARETFSS